jgi:hypothetical protein
MELAARLTESGGANMQRDVRISHSVLPEELLQKGGGLGVDEDTDTDEFEQGTAGSGGLRGA